MRGSVQWTSSRLTSSMGKQGTSARPTAKPTTTRPVPLPAVAARAPWRTEWEPGERMKQQPWRGITFPKSARFPEVKALRLTPIYKPARRRGGAGDTDKAGGTSDG